MAEWDGEFWDVDYTTECYKYDSAFDEWTFFSTVDEIRDGAPMPSYDNSGWQFNRTFWP